MVLDGISGFAADLGQEGCQIAAFEFNRGATLATDQVVAVAEVRRGVAVAPVLTVDPPHKPYPGKEIQGTVDGHQSKGLAELPGPVVDLRRRGMALVFQHCPYHRSPGLRIAEPAVFEFLYHQLFG
jgi:hypothetical protein